MSTIERYGKYDFSDKDHVDLLLKKSQFAKLQVEAIALENPLAIFWRGVQAADSVNSFHS